ncbi:MAG: gamma-glutamyltransferase, partial [Shewanella sp.]|nr:gamma-glutamyltransferase [Shewanella sp.]
MHKPKVFSPAYFLVAICVYLPLAVNATTQPISTVPAADNPAIFSSLATAQPQWAAHGMVSSQEALATGVGVDILKQGGNAIDATVAIGFALAVTLPRAGNIGGGGFMLYHSPKQNISTAIDYREMAPSSAHKTLFQDEHGNVDSTLSKYHGLAVGVPGTVAGFEMALHK